MTTERYGSFEWHAEKAKTNIRKHGVAFEEALTAFADSLAVDAPDRYIPRRAVLIGMSVRRRVLFVVYEERGDIIRLISARQASPSQRRKYEEGFDTP